MPIDKAQAQTIFKVLFVFGGAYMLYKITTPKPRKSLKKGQIEVLELTMEEGRPYIQPPPLMDELDAQNNPDSARAHLALCVYIDGYNNGTNLDLIGEELKNDLGMKVYRRRSDDFLVVKDLNDKDIMEYDVNTASQLASANQSTLTGVA